LRALGWAVLTMAVVIVLVDQLFWRPLIAWADKFKLEQSAAAEAPRSWLLDLLRAARLPRRIGALVAPLRELINRLLAQLSRPRPPRAVDPARQRVLGQLYNMILMVLVVGLVALGVAFVVGNVGW